jgi:hypothetical protein
MAAEVLKWNVSDGPLTLVRGLWTGSPEFIGQKTACKSLFVGQGLQGYIYPLTPLAESGLPFTPDSGHERGARKGVKDPRPALGAFNRQKTLLSLASKFPAAC